MEKFLYAEVREIGHSFFDAFRDSYGIRAVEVSTLGECDPQIAPELRLRYCLKVRLATPQEACDPKPPEEFREVRMFYHSLAPVVSLETYH